MRSIPRLPGLAFLVVFATGAGAAFLPAWPAPVRLLLAATVAAGAAILTAKAVAEPIEQLTARVEIWQTSGHPEGAVAAAPRLKELQRLAAAMDRAAVASVAAQSRSEEALAEMLRNWARIYEGRDPLSTGHGSRVSDYAAGIAEAMGRPAVEVERIRLGALVHDIGKTGIGDALLNKPGSLSEAEMEVIKRHPLIGRKMLEGVAAFEPLLPVVELHHENFDGTGYPWGVRGGEIPLAARIVRVADAFDAMTSDRPYREAMSPEQAMENLRRGVDTQFDPDVVEAFLRGIHRQRVIVRTMPEQLASLQEGLARQGGRNLAPVVSIEGAKARIHATEEEEETATAVAPLTS